MLELEEGDPVLRHARRAVSDGRIVEVSRTCYRHDRFTVYLQLNDR
jgi:GntR family transcriptional regulator